MILKCLNIHDISQIKRQIEWADEEIKNLKIQNIIMRHILVLFLCLLSLISGMRLVFGEELCQGSLRNSK